MGGSTDIPWNFHVCVRVDEAPDYPRPADGRPWTHGVSWPGPRSAIRNEHTGNYEVRASLLRWQACGQALLCQPPTGPPVFFATYLILTGRSRRHMHNEP